VLHKTLSNEKFCDMMEEHIEDILGYLFEENINFSILTNVADIDFEPPLPSHITETFKPITMFVLAGYTFESSLIEDGVLSFEAGFGSENIGSLVSIPLLAILQIIVEETPIFINLSITESLRDRRKEVDKGVKKSMEALLSNPENKKLLKK